MRWSNVGVARAMTVPSTDTRLEQDRVPNATTATPAPAAGGPPPDWGLVDTGVRTALRHQRERDALRKEALDFNSPPEVPLSAPPAARRLVVDQLESLRVAHAARSRHRRPRGLRITLWHAVELTVVGHVRDHTKPAGSACDAGVQGIKKQKCCG